MVLLLAGCSKHDEAAKSDGYAPHQSLILAGAAVPADERRLVILEDERITPAIRQAMWGGSKDPAHFLAAVAAPPAAAPVAPASTPQAPASQAPAQPATEQQTGTPQPAADATAPAQDAQRPDAQKIDAQKLAALTKSLDALPLRSAIVRLTDGAGKVIYERKLDCELAAVSDHALPQGAPNGQGANGQGANGQGANGPGVWRIDNDCSTGEGQYAGLITRFASFRDGKLVWQTYGDEQGQRQELTLVQATRIAWQAQPADRIEQLLEVICHPDFNDARMRALKPGEAPPVGVPLVVDDIRYKYEGGDNWIRAQKSYLNAFWDTRQPFPDTAMFPPS